jgi:LPXTG-site transpeptidase (sortase) family protein
MSSPNEEPSTSRREKVRRQLRSAGKKILLALLLFVVIFGAWNWATLTSVTQPQVHSFLVAIGRAPSTPDYDASQDRFLFPRLGIDAPLSEHPDSSPLNYQDWNSIRDSLVKGVSLNYSSSTLDAAKLAYVTGHSSDTYPHPYSSVFAGLGQAKEGDEFVLTGNNEVNTYKVISKRVLDPRDVTAFSEAALTAGAQAQRVAVVTCWPLLTSLKRLVLVGEKMGSNTKVGYTGTNDY